MHVSRVAAFHIFLPVNFFEHFAEDIQQIYEDPDFDPVSAPISSSYGSGVVEPKFYPG